MTYSLKGIALISLIGTLFIPQAFALGDTISAERFNNGNWYILPHPRVATFSVNADGSATGFTEDGISFAQFNVPNTYGIRVERFEIQDHYHYIVDGEIADSLTEFSVLLANAYNALAQTV